MAPRRLTPEEEKVRREKYFRRLNLPQSPDGAQKAALDRAHDLRRFEIENYWRRATYFWGFQLVAFGALALSAKDGRVYPHLALYVAVLGALTAYAALLTARGSKFWQENWEAHVDVLEAEIEGCLHKTVPVRESGLAPSVSRVNERLLRVLLTGWLGVFAAAAVVLLWPQLAKLDPMPAAIIQVIAAIVALGWGGGYLMKSPVSDVGDRTVRFDDFEPFP